MGMYQLSFILSWSEMPPEPEIILRDITAALDEVVQRDDLEWKNVSVLDTENLNSVDSSVKPYDFWRIRNELFPKQGFIFISDFSYQIDSLYPCEVYVFDANTGYIGPDWIRHTSAVVRFPLHEFMYPSEIIGVDSPDRSIVDDYTDRTEFLVAMLRAIVRAVSPSVAYLQSENHSRMYPFNSFLAYYRTAKEVVKDIVNLESRWESPFLYPNERYGDPLRMQADDKLTLSALRTQSQRESLYQAFCDRFPLGRRVTEEHVFTVLSDKRTDVFWNLHSEGAGDFAVCLYPAIVNNFVDSFYLRVLDRAAEG